MAADRSYIAENDTERKRLEAFVSRASDQQLATPMPAGWTVAAVLAHLAFWDQRIVLLLDQWTKAGVDTVPRTVADHDAHWINDAGKPHCLALPPRTAAQLAVAAAEAADTKLAALPDQFLAANLAAGSPLIVVRARHRKEHLDEIERALGGARERG